MEKRAGVCVSECVCMSIFYNTIMSSKGLLSTLSLTHSHPSIHTHIHTPQVSFLMVWEECLTCRHYVWYHRRKQCVVVDDGMRCPYGS